MNDNANIPIGYFEFANEEVRGWALEGSAVHLRCVTKFGDPVELIADEVQELIDHLEKLKKLIE